MSKLSTQRRLRVVFLNGSAGIGGAEHCLTHLASKLDPNIFEVTVICPKQGPLSSYLKSHGIHVIPMDINYFSRQQGVFGFFKYLISLLKLYFILKKIDVNILHCNSYIAAHWGIPLSYFMSVRIICHIRDINYSKFTSLLIRYSYSRIEFISVSMATKQEVINSLGVPDSQIGIIYDGEDTEIYHPNIQSSIFDTEFAAYKHRLKIGIIGRIIEWKRHIDVIEAAKMLMERIDLHIFIVGELWGDPDADFWKKLQSRILILGLSNRLTFTGFRENIPEIMAGLDIIIVPSENEPFGMVTIQSMAMGKPVIGTLSGGTTEIIQDGINGLLVPVKCPEALAHAIETLAYNKEYAAYLGHCARNRVIEAFSLENYVQQIQKLYLQTGASRELLGSAKTPESR
jgi:glycosyltransferase involved in cell wall biosynthesis